MPVTVDVEVIRLADGSETVRSEGTRLGMALGDGGSRGVLASESSSTQEPGEVGMLSSSSGVAGIADCCECDMLKRYLAGSIPKV